MSFDHTRGIDKTAGNLRVKVSEGWSRTVEIERTDAPHQTRIYGLSIEEIRDLHYMLGRVLELVSDEDK